MRSQVGKWLEFIRIDDFCHSKQCRRNSASILPGCAAAGDDEDEDDDDDEDDDEDDVVDDDDDGDGDDGGDDDEDDEDDDNTDGDADEWMLDTKDTLPRAEVLLFFFMFMMILQICTISIDHFQQKQHIRGLGTSEPGHYLPRSSVEHQIVLG